MDTSGILKELNAERVNIVEPDGKLRMAIFNSENMAECLVEGQNPLPGHREGHGEAGIVFYNNHEDECGGMGYSSASMQDGSYHSSLSFTFDQYKQDQVVQVFSREQNGKRQYGFQVFDRPETSILQTIEGVKILRDPATPEAEKERLYKEMAVGNAVRMTLAKDPDGSVGVRIMDSKGRERIRMQVGADGQPVFEILDEDGNSIPLKS